MLLAGSNGLRVNPWGNWELAEGVRFRNGWPPGIAITPSTGYSTMGWTCSEFRLKKIRFV